MEAALVGVATGAMKPLLSKLSMLLQEEHAKFKGVRRDARFIGDEMRSMKASLEALADAEQIDPEMKIWRDDVRELSYDMEDCLDDFIARVERERDEFTRLQKLFSKFKKLKPRHEIACEIKELKARAIDASERHKRYNIVKPIPDCSSSVSTIDPRLQALYVEVDKLVGFHGPKKHIMKWFKREGSMELKVVSIVGPGGIGKTTLANQVYHTIKSQFSCVAFVSVSRNPNMKKILWEIAKQVGVTDIKSDDDLQPLIDKLRDHLKDKRYLVVIDDVWDTQVWETISLALLNNNCGSRIITTTRINGVASCSSKGGHFYAMKPLSLVDSKRLFFKRAFGSEYLCYPHLENVSNEILKKCGGLPLAIITLSSLLSDQIAEDEWNRVLTAIGSALAKDPDAGNMTKILSLSYFDLPLHLRTCLLYLSVFQEDRIIGKQHLISKWIAEGFIRLEQGRSTYEIGEGYFSDLINRSLIQPVDAKYGQAEACQVHDIILDFITCKAAEENFVTSFDGAEHGHISNCIVRRLRVINHNNEKVTMSTSVILSHVRSITVFGHFIQVPLLAFPALRVLDLGECRWLRDHLANIEKLFHLKYLRLGQYQVTELPTKVGKLQYLETLDLRNTRIQVLPSTIISLTRLTRLYVNCRTRFPDGVIGKMQSLEDLGEFGVFNYDGVNSLQEFGQLTKLRTLVVQWCLFWSYQTKGRSLTEVLQSYVGTLISSQSLHHLCILKAYTGEPPPYPVSLERWCSTTTRSLRKLDITYGYIDKVPSWMSSLGNLREVNLYIFNVKPEDIAILGAIPTLFFLKLRTFCGTNGRIFIPGPGFGYLKYFYLKIEFCGILLDFEAGSMPKLECLKLEFPMHKMECMNDVSDFGIKDLSDLTKVELLINVDHHYADKVQIIIETAVKTLPNPPVLSFLRGYVPCVHIDEISDETDNEEGWEEEECSHFKWVQQQHTTSQAWY